MSSTPVQKNKPSRGYKRPAMLFDVSTHYCAGCGHGTVHRLIAEVIEEMGMREQTIGVAPVGCSVLAYDYLRIDMVEAPHGRAPAVATGVKRVQPDKLVFAYQGDGDLAAIGTAETIHTANRGENLSVIFINNTVYGMTGGQMAPTTLIDQKTTTTPTGRQVALHGNPIRVCEMLATLDGTTYIERLMLTSPGNIRKIKKAIRKSFDIQMAGKGYSLVEILSPCPTYMRMNAIDALKHVEQVVSKYFPVGVFKDTTQAGS